MNFAVIDALDFNQYRTSELTLGVVAKPSPSRVVTTFGHIRCYNGKLSCFFAGVSTFLSFNIASARAMRLRVECGMMTSSM
jgi:hypothetical protein